MTNHTKNYLPSTIAPNDRVLRFKEVTRKVGLSRSHIHSLITQDKFPPILKLGDRASGFLESQVNAWLEHRIAQSQTDTAA
jgi:predicted DNA-binding transcriptional regulator AlpA